ncbi:MAG: hypothetical protein LBO79_07590 [Zoogloeaceae bacterium]|jgi:hypothetical protein|nr:hypothetical protein [Zoogloeaceae bacterium]
MKTGFRHGLILLAGLIFSVAAMANEPVPIEDRDAFEKEYLACLKTGLRNKCFSTLFSSHLDYNFKDLEVLGRIDDLSANQLADCPPVYDVHVVDKILRGGVLDSRTYLIECSDRSFVGVYVNFRKTRNEWYVSAFSVWGSDEFIKKILKLPTD